MAKQAKLIVLTIVIISIAALVFFSIPNSKASENLAMVTMFEPDESSMFPIIKQMVGPQPDLKHTIYRFFAYGFYSYGLPHFAPSAVVYKILTLVGQGDNMPVVMLSLRQIITVLPMLASLWVLVYLQDQFKSWRSIALFVFLLSVPAVIQNGFWWHPDGLVMLFSSLVIYFLWKDDRSYGKHFNIAALLCGVLVALKVVGFFFFLTIAMVLIWGLAEKKLTRKQFFQKAFLFLAIMAISIIAASPHLLVPIHRAFAFTILKREIFETSKGYGIFYAKGLQAAWPTLTAFYGKAVFLIITLAVSVWSLWDKQTRFLRALILSWFLPLSIHLLFFSHFKYQYWLPVALPLFSNLAFLLPIKTQDDAKSKNTTSLRLALLLVIILQFGLFLVRDSELYTVRNNRKEDSTAVTFYEKAVEELAPVTEDMRVYYDYRLYMPDTEGWLIENSFDLLTYDYIQSRNFSILFLSQQRILDYLQPEAVGIDPLTFPFAQQFYRDANEGEIEGYRLLLREKDALLFIQESLCSKFYSAARCQ